MSAPKIYVNGAYTILLVAYLICGALMALLIIKMADLVSSLIATLLQWPLGFLYRRLYSIQLEPAKPGTIFVAAQPSYDTEGPYYVIDIDGKDVILRFTEDKQPARSQAVTDEAFVPGNVPLAYTSEKKVKGQMTIIMPVEGGSIRIGSAVRIDDLFYVPRHVLAAVRSQQEAEKQVYVIPFSGKGFEHAAVPFPTLGKAEASVVLPGNELGDMSAWAVSPHWWNAVGVQKATISKVKTKEIVKIYTYNPITAKPQFSRGNIFVDGRIDEIAHNMSTSKGDSGAPIFNEFMQVVGFHLGRNARMDPTLNRAFPAEFFVIDKFVSNNTDESFDDDKRHSFRYQDDDDREEERYRKRLDKEEREREDKGKDFGGFAIVKSGKAFNIRGNSKAVRLSEYDGERAQEILRVSGSRWGDFDDDDDLEAREEDSLKGKGGHQVPPLTERSSQPGTISIEKNPKTLENKKTDSSSPSLEKSKPDESPEQTKTKKKANISKARKDLLKSYGLLDCPEGDLAQKLQALNIKPLDSQSQLETLTKEHKSLLKKQ